MQNDAVASRTLLLHTASEEKKKQLTAFLQRRNIYRNGLPQNPASEHQNPPNDSAPTHVAQNGGKSEINERPRPDHPVKKPTDEKEPGQLDALVPTSIILKQPPSSGNPGTTSSDDLRPHMTFGLVVVCSNFRYLPSLADGTKDIANQLFQSLTDSHFGQFSRRGSKVLVNPSLIEFQDTMKELTELATAAGEGATFFLCLASHGARVTGGVSEGSYVLFCETRLSSEEELLLTALHENDLAKMIHAIPCKNKLLALELCQVKQSLEKPLDEAPTIVNRVHEAFTSRLYSQLLKLELLSQQARQPTLTEAGLLSAQPPLFNTVLLDSCTTKSEAPVRSPGDNVSNFLHRLNDAFHGAAGKVPLHGDDHPTQRSSFTAKAICTYVKATVEQDARTQNELVKAEYTKQLRTKYELVAQFEDITHTPQAYGLDCLADFRLGYVPAAPELSPAPPLAVSATTSSITIAWEASFGGFHPTTSVEVPSILGFHVEIRADGRACERWRRASDYQLLSFDKAFREKKTPPAQTTVNGLPSDTGFRFRIRARTAGGWGPFSKESPPIWSRSCASVHDTFSAVDNVFRTRGLVGLLELMEASEYNRDILRTCIEISARAAVKDAPIYRYKPSLPVPPSLAVRLVEIAVKAAEKFIADGNLARFGCLLIGRLAQSDDACRKAILAIQEPHQAGTFLDQVVERFAATQPDTCTTARWAKSALRGISGRFRMTPEAAARCIQGLYRTRKARRYMRTLASAVYTQHVDASTGQLYFYNSQTGTTSWSLPRFLGP